MSPGRFEPPIRDPAAGNPMLAAATEPMPRARHRGASWRVLNTLRQPAHFGAGRDPALDQRIAVHEWGHALVSHALGRGQVQRLALQGAA